FRADAISRGVFAQELAPAPDHAQVLAFDHTSLHELRSTVARCAARWDMSASRIDDLQLAVSEIGANSVMHAGGRGTFRIWSDGRAIMCEMQDQGRITDPLVGRRKPSVEDITGRGLYLVHELCDLVQVRSTAGGTLVRIRLHIAG
nr:ATP-binding protein [Pseudonocardiales bacterium]